MMSSSTYWAASTIVASAALLCVLSPASADQPRQSGAAMHTEVGGVVAKMRSQMVFVKPEHGLALRAISIKKCERLGILDAKPGDQVTFTVDEGNVLVDVHKATLPAQGHRHLTGTLNYADPFWEEIKLSTPDGIQRFDVDTLAGTRLSVIQEGEPIAVELDEANVVIDIHRAR